MNQDFKDIMRMPATGTIIHSIFAPLRRALQKAFIRRPRPGKFKVKSH
jgi:hypothetical protein